MSQSCLVGYTSVLGVLSPDLQTSVCDLVALLMALTGSVESLLVVYSTRYVPVIHLFYLVRLPDHVTKT